MASPRSPLASPDAFSAALSARLRQQSAAQDIRRNSSGDAMSFAQKLLPVSQEHAPTPINTLTSPERRASSAENGYFSPTPLLRGAAARLNILSGDCGSPLMTYHRRGSTGGTGLHSPLSPSSTMLCVRVPQNTPATMLGTQGPLFSPNEFPASLNCRMPHASLANGFHGGSFFDAFPASNTPMASLHRQYQSIRQEGSPMPSSPMGFASTPRPMPHRARSTRSNEPGFATPPLDRAQPT